jgi:hypothetical protein
VNEAELIRRRLLKLGPALPPLAALAAGPGSSICSSARPVPRTVLTATPAIAADDEPTPEPTEGPYFTPGSPLRRTIVPARAPGTPRGRYVLLTCLVRRWRKVGRRRSARFDFVLDLT